MSPPTDAGLPHLLPPTLPPDAAAHVRTAIDELREVVFLCDADGRWTFLNRAWTEITGFPVAETLGQPFLDYLHPEDVALNLERTRPLLAREKLVCRHVIRYRTRDADYRWMEVHARLVLGPAGELVGTAGTLSDVSERVQAEASLRHANETLEQRVAERTAELRAVIEWLHRAIRERKAAEAAARRSEQYYRSLTENVYDLVVVVSAQGEVRYQSPSVARRMGYAPDELIGTAFLAYLHPDDRPAIARAFQALLREAGSSAEVVTRLRTPDGAWRTVEAVATNLLELPAVGGVVISARDISERVAAEARVRQSEADYRGLFEHAHDAILIIEPEGEIVLDVNPAACALYGYPRDEFVGLSLERVSTDVEQGRRAVASTLQNTLFRGPELAQRRRDGALVYVEITAAVVEYRGRRAILSINRDVTARKQVEAALHESQAQLLQAQKMEAIGRLAGGIAHDFNNMLTAIAGHAQLLLMEPAHEEHTRWSLEEIRKATERSASLTKQLLAFSRKQVLQPEVFCPNAVVADVAPMLRRLIGEHIALVCLPDPALGRVRADPGQLEQVLLNLVVNARDAMPGGGTVTIRTRQLPEPPAHAAKALAPSAAGYALLEVADTGCGMSAEVREHLFEPFFTTKPAGQGTGLGLSTVYGIVTQSGGTLEVQSEPGAGAVFRICLPCSEQRAPAAGDAADGAPLSRGSETVLLAEDEPAVRAVVAGALRRAGYRVLEAESGAHALALAATQPDRPDLLLTDLVMPGMSGRELAGRLRALRPGVHVVYMTGYTDDTAAVAGPEGAEALLQKPFSADLLARTLRQVLDGRGAT